MQDAIILGGGITGLTAGYLLQQKGLDITVIEKSSQAGGPIQSARQDGYLVELGPNSLLLPDPWVESFIDELGLNDQLLETHPSASKRYIIKKGRPVAVPASPLQAITTSLFSFKAKFGFLAEPFRKQISDQEGAKETVASFVSRRMGPEFLDYAIDPFVSGVYAGDPSNLILEYAFPLMRGFERDGGSIIRGAFKYKKRRKAEGTAYKKRSISFRDGLDTLPKTIARKLGNRLWLDTEAVAINESDGGWQVTWKRDGENFEGFAKQLIVCLPADAIKNLAWSGQIAELLHATPDLDYPAVHSLALGFRTDQIRHPLDGFGMLAPSVENRNILGALFSSSLYEQRAPSDHCLLTVMIGGIRRPDLADKKQDELTSLALEELGELIGLKGDPTFAHLSSWPRAIPQYSADFGPWSKTLRNLEADLSGLHFGGHAIDGIAMGACLMSGKKLAGVVSEEN